MLWKRGGGIGGQSCSGWSNPDFLVSRGGKNLVLNLFYLTVIIQRGLAYMIADEDDVDASSQIPLDDGSPPDYGAIEVIQCLIEHHNPIFTDANETVWR